MFGEGQGCAHNRKPELDTLLMFQSVLLELDIKCRGYNFGSNHLYARSDCRDHAVLALQWPLVWVYRGEHPVAGKFTSLGPLDQAAALSL